ncbi:glucose oxidase [Diplodia corticola]|uniref:Glucose oxidase n=1 Tax=Diplodia corticola TaxID=236234 RepID=A0A1J9R4P5_9PEZI|nr:glucose oxidase [Diplodia corticola]OJD35545.1 glucose oxidase [Diplodia corticola]
MLLALLATFSFCSLRLGALAAHAPSAYDYIVVGGGTCGLVVANRLSENANVSVLIIEAGYSVHDNPNVTDPNGYGKAFNTAIDNLYKTVPQMFANKQNQTLHAAKALGGTSTINGMAYTRAEAAQIDAWEKVGNAGWNWKALYPYYLKSERYQIPTSEQIAAGATFNLDYHGLEGPLAVGYPKNQAIDEFPAILRESYQAIGIPFSQDVNGGSMRGFTVYPKTVDEEANVREDAARAYYWPFSTSRQNLHLSLNSTVTRVIWKPSTGPGGEAMASAVEVLAANGTKITFNASREIIVSAGALRTPSILELSGIGNTQILSKAGIETKVSLPGVGEHLVDQINSGITFSKATSQTYTGAAGYAAYPNVTDVFGNSTSAFASSVLAALPAYASAISAQNNNCTSAQDMLSLLKLQHSLIFEAQVPVAEIVSWPEEKSFGSQYWSTLPFSRGNVHVTSSNPSTAAKINPNYFMLEYDLDSQVAIARWMRKLFAAAPLADVAGAETWPGTKAVAANAGDAAWSKWLKQTYRGNYHVLSTAVMMPREKGGVVDERLKVYGTANVRVVDASVLPFQVCGHLMSTLYAVAERASDLIKEDGGL